MPFVNYYWDNNPTHTVYRIYYSDTTFDSTTLPSTFDEINPSEGINTKSVYAPYRSKMYSMFEVVETVDGADTSTFGDLLNVATLEDFIGASGTVVSRYNSNVDKIKELDLGTTVRSICYDKELDSVFVLAENTVSGAYNFYSLNPTTLTIKWQHDDILGHTYFDTYIPSEYRGSLANNCRMKVLDGHVYVNMYNTVIMVKADGTNVHDDTASDVRLGYTKPLSPVDGVNIEKVLDFDFSDDGSHLYLLSNDSIVSRHPRNFTGNFHLSDNTTDRIEYQLDMGTTSPRIYDIFFKTGSTSKIVITHGDIDDVVAVSEYDIDTQAMVDVTSNFLSSLTTGTRNDMIFRMKKNGKLYINQFETNDTGAIQGTVFTIIDLSNYTQIGNRLFNKYTEATNNIIFSFNMDVFGDGQTLISNGETVRLTIYDPVDDELINSSQYYSGVELLTYFVTLT